MLLPNDGVSSGSYYNQKWINVKFQKEGIHHYPEALTNPALKSVEFLGHPHRHVFHFDVKVTVNHDNRDIEFIMFKRELEGLYESGAMNIEFMSCEMLATALAEYIMEKYPKRTVHVAVSEDGESGAIVQYFWEAL